jgi:hypothetical protein
MELYYAKQKRQFPHLEQIYFVKPEEQKWLLLDDKMVNDECFR